jgi:hypothetical protein
MPFGAYRISQNAVGGGGSGGVRTASTVSGTRPATVAGLFSNSIRWNSGVANSSFQISMPQTVGASPTTIEMWFYYNDTAYAGCKSFQIGTILLLTDSNGWNLRSGTDNSSSFISNTTVTNAAFRHVCLQTSGNNTWHWWINGVYITSFSKTTSFSQIDIGKMYYQGYESSVQLRVDEVRVSKVERYTSGSNLTVPTSAFVNDSNTVALFHCNTTTETDDIS